MDAQEYVFKLTADIQNFTQNMDTVAKKISLTEKQASTFTRNLSKAMSSASPDVQRLGRDMSNLASQYSSQIASFQKWTATLTDATNHLAQLSETHDAQAAAVARSEEEVNRLAEAYAKAKDKQDAMNASIAAGNNVKADVWSRINSDVLQTSSALETATAKHHENLAALQSTENAMSSWGRVAQTSAASAMNMAEGAAASKREMLGMAVGSKLLTGISTIFSVLSKKALSLSAQLAKLVKSGIGKLGSKIKELAHNFREHNTQSSILSQTVSKLTHSFGSFGNLLLRRFKRQVISSIFNALKEGIQSVAKESPSFNAAMSNMFGSLTTFANALGAAFAPILEMVAPYITSFVNFLTEAVGKVGQLTAALTGKSSFMKAIPVQKDYAASLSDTSKSADKATNSTKKANKATQDYKKTVLSFDQLHKMDGKDTDNSSDDTSSSNPLDATKQAFQNQQIDSKVKGIADELAKAFQAHDWKKLGSLMADGVNKAFSWVDNIVKWENCGEKITEVVNGITETFNSFVKNLNWSLIGKTFGDLIKTIVNTLYLFIKGIDWGALGAGFGEGLKSLFETVDWGMVGALLVAKFQALLYFIQGLVSTPGLFEAIGTALRDAIGGMIDELDPTAWGDTISKVINGFFTILAEGFGDFEKFTELGEKLATNLNTAVDGIDADKFGEGVSNLIISLLSALIAFIETTDWEAFGQKVADMISAVDWAGVADKLFEAIGAALGGLTDFIWGLIKDAWEDVVNYWKDKCFEDGQFSIGGLLDGIVEGLKNIGTWIKEHIFQPFIDGFKKAFGIASPSKKMKKQGGFIIDGLLGGIVNALKDIGTWVTDHIFTPILDAIKTAFGFVGDVAQGVFDIGAGIVSGIVDGLSGIGDSITSALSTVEDVIKAPFEAAWNFISPIIDGIKNFKLPDWVTDNFITNGISSAGSAIGGWFKDIGSFITFADGGFPEDGLFFANHNELVGGFANGRTAVANNSQIITGIEGGVERAMSRVMSRYANSGSSGDVVLVVGEEELARANLRGMRSIDKRTNPSIVFA